MAGHIIADYCKTPSAYLWRVGSVWTCECGRQWALQREGPYGRTRTWTKVKDERT